MMQDLVRKELTQSAHLVVVKVGTRVLTTSQGTLDESQIECLARQIQQLREQGRQVVLISSGAVGAGMSQLGLTERPAALSQLQAVAAVGQAKLIEAYDSIFRRFGQHAAQVLLTAEDLRDRGRYLNVRNTLLALLEINAVPIVNENDTVAVEELRLTFGDNDRLAALVTTAIRAPLLVVLSDVDGLYDGPPNDSDSRVISTVDKIDASIEALVSDSANGLSRGGMRSKLEAARTATKAGESMIIASGREPDVLVRLLAGEQLGTVFLAEGKSVSPFKRWLGFSTQPQGALTLDDGACRAITQQGRSLLAIGITAVRGEFGKGDAVRLCTGDGNEIGRGLSNYTAEEVRQIQGLKAEEIRERLGHLAYKGVIHRDNLTVTARQG